MCKIETIPILTFFLLFESVISCSDKLICSQIENTINTEKYSLINNSWTTVAHLPWEPDELPPVGLLNNKGCMQPGIYWKALTVFNGC